jgi:uncharacterized membrane protein YkoI
MSKRLLVTGVVGLVVGCGAYWAFAAAADKSLTPDKLPAAVSKTFKAAFPNGQIEKLDAEEENGVMVYDIEFKDGATEKETDITADGTMLEVTIVIEPKDLPPVAKKAIEKAAENGKLGRTEHIEISYGTKDGKVIKLPKTITHYAAELAKGDQAAEVVTEADGKVIEPAKWETAKVEKPEVKLELPDATMKTFKKTFPKGEIFKVDVDVENGVVVYDIEFKDAAVEKETDITSDGTMLEFTVVVEAKAVPEAAMKTVQKAAEGGKIGRIEKIELSYDTKDGKAIKKPKTITYYAIAIEKGGQSKEMSVNPDGTMFELVE